MSKRNRLTEMYDDLRLDSTEAKVLLSKLSSGEGTNEEIDELLETVQHTQNGGRKLDEIKEFESGLITDFELKMQQLKELEDDDNDVAHEDEQEQKKLMPGLKKRYKILDAEFKDILKAMEIAYFQIKNYTEYQDRFEKGIEYLGHLE